jgi:hypothetical protein
MGGGVGRFEYGWIWDELSITQLSTNYMLKIPQEISSYIPALEH